MDLDTWLARDSAATDLRDKNKRKRSSSQAQRPATELDSCAESSGSFQRRETQHCLEEGAWIRPPRFSNSLLMFERIALALGLCGICTSHVRSLGLWVYLKENQANIGPVQAEASKLGNTELAKENMLQHICFFFQFLEGRHKWSYCDRTSRLSKHKQQQHQQIALNLKHGQQRQTWLTSMRCLQCMPISLRHMPRTHVGERRMRCIQFKHDLADNLATCGADMDVIYMYTTGSTFSYPSSMKHNPCIVSAALFPVKFATCSNICYKRVAPMEQGIFIAYVPRMLRPWLQCSYDSQHMQATWLTTSNRNRTPRY